MKTTRTLGALATVALLVTLAACGGDGEPDAADSPEGVVRTVLLAGLDRDAAAVCANSVNDKGEAPTDASVEACEKEVQAAMDADKANSESLDGEAKKQRAADEEAARKVFSAKPKKIGKEKDGVVTLTYSYEGSDQTLSAKKIDDRWYFAG